MISWHWYGFFVGLAVLLGWSLVEFRVKKTQLSLAIFYRCSWVILSGALVGARVYHLLTDANLYDWPSWELLAVWQGGLSILGAIMGGAVSLWLVRTWWQPSFTAGLWADSLALALPWAQAVGRLGNWVNQELYGLPSSLPWAITIDLAHRLPGYEAVSRYHPLFAYEMLGLVLIGLGLWWGDRKRWLKFGRGGYFAAYLVGYSALRFGLEFLRLDKIMLESVGLSSNQVVMIGVLGLSVGWLVRRWSGVRALSIVILMTVLLSGCQASPQTTLPLLDRLRQVPDRTKLQLQVGAETFEVEVVNQPASLSQGLSGRSEIGADGMLFVLPKRERARFWMKEMQFDLDIAWIDQGKVVEVSTNVPHPLPSTPLHQLPLFSPSQEVELVLEVPANSSIATGSAVNLEP